MKSIVLVEIIFYLIYPYKTLPQYNMNVYIWIYTLNYTWKCVWRFYMLCDDGRYFKHLMYSIYRRLYSCFFWLKHKGYSNLILLYKLIHKSITEKLWVSFVWYTKGKGTLKKSQFLQLKVDNGSFLKKFFTLLWVSYNHISIRITCKPYKKIKLKLNCSCHSNSSFSYS